MNRRSIFSAFLTAPALAVAKAHQAESPYAEPTEPQFEWIEMDKPWGRRYRAVKATSFHPKVIVIEMWHAYGWELQVGRGEMLGLSFKITQQMSSNKPGEQDMNKVFLAAEKFCRKHAPDIFNAE